jgi:predicted RNA-binding protein with PUA-like domain
LLGKLTVSQLRLWQPEITLKELKPRPELEGMVLLRPGNRLSIMPVSEAEWDFILSLETTTL